MDGTSTNTSDATVQLTDCGLKAQAHCTVSQSTHVANHLVRGCEEHACMCTPHHKSSRKMKRGSLMFVAAPSGRRSVMGELCNYKPINTTHIHAHTHAHTHTHTNSWTHANASTHRHTHTHPHTTMHTQQNLNWRRDRKSVSFYLIKFSMDCSFILISEETKHK